MCKIYTKLFIHSNFNIHCHDLWLDLKSHLNYEKEAFITLVASHFVKHCQEERPSQNEYNIHNHKKSDKFDAHFQTIPNHCIKTTGY